MTTIHRYAAQYIRMSTDKQDLSPRIQKSAIESHAQRHGIEIVATYEDDGRSGVHLSNRPALKRLLEDITLGPAFTTVLVYDISRWGRFQNADASAYYEYHCILHGVQVVYVAEAFSNDHSPMSALVKGMKRAMAAEYSRELATKVVAGQRRVIDMGFVMGPPPSLGYRRQSVSADGSTRTLLRAGQRKSALTDRMEWILGPDAEVATVQAIFAWYAAGEYSIRQIAMTLRKVECCDQTGRLITRSHIAGLLRNEALIGNFLWGRSHHQRHLRLVEGESMRVVGRVPRIIDDSTWALVQTRLTGPVLPTQSRQVLIKNLQLALGRNPGLISTDLVAEGCATLSAYKRCFGNWRNALVAADADPIAIAANVAERARLRRNLAFRFGRSLRDFLLVAKVPASFDGRTNALKILGHSIRVRLIWEVVRPGGRRLWHVEESPKAKGVSHTLFVRMDKQQTPKDYFLTSHDDGALRLPPWLATPVPQALQQCYSPSMPKLVQSIARLS